METLKNDNIDNKILKNVKQSIVTKNSINPNDDLDNLSLNSTPNTPTNNNNNININTLSVDKYLNQKGLKQINNCNNSQLKINKPNNENNIDIDKKIDDNENNVIEITNNNDKEDEILNINEIINKENDFYTNDINLNNDEFIRNPTIDSELSQINISSINKNNNLNDKVNYSVNDNQDSDISTISGDENNYEDNEVISKKHTNNFYILNSLNYLFNNIKN
jgi:hypothetical protein